MQCLEFKLHVTVTQYMYITIILCSILHVIQRGTGGFASKAKRFSKTRSVGANTMILGPGSYDPVVPSRRTDFNRSQATR